MATVKAEAREEARSTCSCEIQAAELMCPASAAGRRSAAELGGSRAAPQSSPAASGSATLPSFLAAEGASCGGGAQRRSSADPDLSVHRQGREEEEEESDVWAHAVSERDGVAIL